MATSTFLSTPTSRAAPLYRAPFVLLGAALLLRAVVMIGIYALLPLLLEGFVARNLRDGLAEAPEVNLVSDLPAG